MDVSRYNWQRGRLRLWLASAVATAGDDCIRWPGSGTPEGYGQIIWNGRRSYVSRIVLLLDGRPWHPPLGPYALHSCDNPPCVNPHHLRWGTAQANAIDRYARNGT